MERSPPQPSHAFWIMQCTGHVQGYDAIFLDMIDKNMKSSWTLLVFGNSIRNCLSLVTRCFKGEVRARTLFVLSSSNRGRLLGFIDLMRQKNKRMKQEGLIKHYGILQKMEDSTRYDKEGNKINIEDLLKKIKTKLMLIEDKLQLGD
ncbi:hypothetical protein Tco_1256088 [Tanacetum coccineum]